MPANKLTFKSNKANLLFSFKCQDCMLRKYILTKNSLLSKAFRIVLIYDFFN